jgi:hypothetical protein
MRQTEVAGKGRKKVKCNEECKNKIKLKTLKKKSGRKCPEKKKGNWKATCNKVGKL